MTRYTCALCGRQTQPFVFIGAEAVGPKCAKRANLTPGKVAKAKGNRLRFARPVARREAGPRTADLFENLDANE